MKIAMVAIAVGVIMMIITISSVKALQMKVRDKITAFNGHVLIDNYDNNSSKISLVPVDKNQEFYPDFFQVEEVEHIQAVATKYGIIRTETDFEGIIVKGVGEEYAWKYFEEYLIQGRLPDFTGSLNTEILLSEYLADRLGFEVGDTVVTHFIKEDKQTTLLRPFKVVGTYNSGFQEFDQTYLFADIRHIQRLNKWNENEIGHFEVFVSDFDDIDRVGAQIYEEVGSLLDARTIKTEFGADFEWLALLDFNIVLIIGIMIIIAAINMITALLVLILERAQMIGMLKAMGSSDWSIRKVFLYNASYLMLVGLFFGNLIGIGMLLIQKYFNVIPLDPKTYFVTEAPVYLNWKYITAINLSTLLLCLLILIIPSFIITRISPAKVIKFE
ncbi:FtsX-like permease family protein [Gangjinia marincola]|uniref:FtsX-like permease family protein n=2 Tax=Gangjinia marincola TaxID=578463 RepID=A0ABN1MDJ6_9FLAO